MFTSVLLFLLFGLQSCKRQEPVPRMSSGMNADFSTHLENFVNQLSDRERTPVIHALIFLAREDLDPDFYEGKTMADARQIKLSDELRYRLNDLSAEEILSLSHTQFNKVHRQKTKELQDKKDILAKNNRRLEGHLDAEEMLYKIKFTDLDYNYANVNGKITAYVKARVANNTAKKVSVVNYSIQIKDRLTGQYFSKVQRPKSFGSRIILPGEERSINFTVSSNVPLLGNLPIEQYKSRLEPIFILENAFDEQGGAFRKIPDATLTESIKNLKAEVQFLEEVLEKSKDRKKFTFWKILSTKPDDE